MIPPVHTAGLEVQGLDRDGKTVTHSKWYIRAFELTERLSEPYSLMLDVSTDDLDLQVGRLVGCRSALRFGRGDFERDVHGVVFKADTIGVVRRKLQVRLWVSPSLEVLSLSTRRRVFQGKNAVEIVATLLEPVFERYGGSLDVSLLEHGYLRVRDHCVQMDETDLQFAQRLLAEEGLTFSFRHAGDTEAMVLMPVTAILHSAAGEDEVVPRIVRLHSRGHDTAPEETVRNLQGSTRMRPSQAEASMWDWKSTSPSTVRGRRDPFDGDAAEPESPAAFGEVYEHEAYRPVEESDGAPLFEQLGGEANLIGHRSRLDDVRATGLGSVTGFTDGATFELVDHPTRDLDGLYAVLSVSHRAEFDDDDEDGVSAQNAAGSYSNRFSCFRFADPEGEDRRTFAPKRRPKPLAPGPVTAIVVGPEGEEIHTDPHGRIKVRMHWDREGAARGDHETSCWVPVGQLSAGAGFGAVFIPRVGMEVVVSFLAGDPDRPICTGVVYNGLNPPPYPLPESKTRSVIKTSSSPGGDGFNELSFEDAAGSEEVFLHAQKNLREVVKASHSTSVGGPQSLTVGKDRTKTVSGSQAATIEKDQHTRIEGVSGTHIVGSEATFVGGGGAKGEGDPMVTAGSSTLKVEGKRYVWAKDELILEVGPEGGATTKVKLTPTGIEIDALKSFRLTIGGKAEFMMVPESMSLVAEMLELYAKASRLLLVDKARITSDNEVYVGVGKTSSLKLDADAALHGGAVTLAAKGKASLGGKEVAVDATTKKVEISGVGGVTIDSAANVAVTAGGEASLKGTIVRGN